MNATSRAQIPTWPFIGHAELGRMIVAALQADRLPLALGFFGPRAVGKASAAVWLAQANLCQHPSARPCGQCAQCRQVMAGTHPSVMVVNPPDQEAIKTDHIRDVLSSLHVASWSGQRWLIIVDAERLTESAGNTMLKFLEELPSAVRVIMTSAAPDRLLPTIVSRLAVYQWHFVSHQAVQRQHPEWSLETVAAAAGRPGWLMAPPDFLPAATAAQAIAQSWDEQRPAARPSTNADTVLATEELVLRDMLLQRLGCTTRRLWPTLTTTVSVSRVMNATERYLQRYDYSQNIQPRLLYDDLHVV